MSNTGKLKTIIPLSLLFTLLIVGCKDPTQKLTEVKQKSLDYQSADISFGVSESTLGDATIKFLKVQDGDLSKIQRKIWTAYGEEMTQYFTSDSDGLRIIERKNFNRLCNANNDICLEWSKSYFDSSGITRYEIFRDTIPFSETPNFDSVELIVQAPSSGLGDSSMYQMYLELKTEIERLDFKPAKLFSGGYIYYADAASFRSCIGEKSLDVNSYELEVNYLKMNKPMQAIYTEVIGRIDTLPNMEDKLTEHLTVYEITVMDPNKTCTNE